MKKKFALLLLAFLLGSSSLQSRVHIRRVGPDNRTEEQKQKEKQEGMTYGIIIAVVIGGLVIWGKIRNS
jgi:hypothetical protein